MSGVQTIAITSDEAQIRLDRFGSSGTSPTSRMGEPSKLLRAPAR